MLCLVVIRKLNDHLKNHIFFAAKLISFQQNTGEILKNDEEPLFQVDLFVDHPFFSLKKKMKINLIRNKKPV